MANKTNTIDILDRFLGCIIGSALGDALGFTVEFSSMQAIFQRFGAQGIRELQTDHGMKGRGLKGKALFSDDTQMSMAVIEGLIDAFDTPIAQAEDGPDDDLAAQAIIPYFIEWRHSPENNRAPGGACLSGVALLERGMTWHKAGGPETNSMKDGGKGGCGSVMRSHPYGLAFFNDPIRATEMAAAHSKMTHGAPLAQAASAALAAAVAAAVQGADWQTICDDAINAAYIYDQGTGDMLNTALLAAEDENVKPAKILEMWQGWAGHEAIAAALFCFARTMVTGGDFKACIRLGANSPGDSDSIAAIAGAIAGAFWGIKNIDYRWVEKLEKAPTLDLLARRLHKATTNTVAIVKKEAS